MAPQHVHTNNRTGDPYLDRRCGEDRRQVHHLNFFARGGIERRREKERRAGQERRKSCIQVTQWSSVCLDAISKESDKVKIH